MQLLAVAVLMAAFATPATAGTLTCSFTEPFFTISFDSKTGIVTYESPNEFDAATGKPKPRVIAEGARIRRPSAWQDTPKLVLERPGTRPGDPFVPVVEMAITGDGSDGMSDFVFPFSGHYEQWAGGCETGKAPAYDMAEVFEDVGVVEDR